MKMLRITIILFLVIALAASLLSACGANLSANPVEDDADATVDTPAAEELAKAPSQETEAETLSAAVADEAGEPTSQDAEPEAPASEIEAEEKAETEPAEAEKDEAETVKTPEAPKPAEAPASAKKPAPAAPATTPAPTPAPTQKPAPAAPVATPAPTPAPKPVEAHTHGWTPVTKTVHHDAVTEQVKVVDVPGTEGWEEIQNLGWCVCQCGARFSGNNGVANNLWGAHRSALLRAWEEAGNDAFDFTGHCSCYNETEYITVWHEGTPEVSHTETKVVKEAWDETVTTGYVCACGATKAA